MSETIEFFFDYSCPYAYLGSTRIEAVAARAGAALSWRPMLLGGVFRELGTPQNLGATLSPAKARHNDADLRRWAGVWQVPLEPPPAHPLRTVEALRATLAAPPSHRVPLIHRLYRAYWVEGLDIGKAEVLEALLADVGLGRELAGPFDARVKDALRANTDEAVARGVFGAPTMFARGEAYFGQDRLWMLARALGAPHAQGDRAQLADSPLLETHIPESGALPEEASVQPGDEFTFWYDFSSPFTYLASTQVPAMSVRTCAAMRWRPFLLGGLFRALGGPDAPLATFSPAKQRYVAKDMQRWAEYWGVPYRWPSRFPMRTILPLRVAIALGEVDADPFVERTFRAYWAEDRDISTPEVIAELLTDCGMDPAIVERASEPEVKGALIANTEAAAAAGLFGAPSFTVRDHLVWGQDRLGFVERLMRRASPA